jgi:hypothetical protein
MPEGNKMNNGPSLAHPDDVVDSRWLFPLERAPPPPRDVAGCSGNGSSCELARSTSNGHASGVATVTLAHYEEIISEIMISLTEQALAECAELAAHAQQVGTARSTALAVWRCQEDAANMQALAKEAGMQRHCDDTLRSINDGFAINLDIIAVEVASWHDKVDDAMALLAMQRRKDDADAQGYHDGRAAATANVLQKAAARVNMLAGSRSQEDDTHTKAFTSAADKRNCWEATLLATLPKYTHHLGFGSYDDFVAWRAEHEALAADEGGAPEQASALCERVPITDMELGGHAWDSPPTEMTATAFGKDTQCPVMDDTTPQ